MKKAIYIVTNSQEFVCNKEYIMKKSPVVRKYFENDPKADFYICNLDLLKGNESSFKDFLNGSEINITYDLIPFVKNLSKVFQLNCFDDQIQLLEKSYIKTIKVPDHHFITFGDYSKYVFDDSYESISQELSINNFQFFARSFLSLIILNPSKIDKVKSFLKQEELEKNILIYKEFEDLLKMKHFILYLRECFLSMFLSPMLLKHFDSEVQFEMTKKEERKMGVDNFNIDFNENQKELEIDLHLKLANALLSIIESDDVDTLQMYISKPEFDINSRFFEVSLIEYAAFLSSINCFKFLLNNHIQIDKNKIGAFAIAGGNAEIIHICEQKGVNFKGTLEIAVAFQHCDLINWLIETKNQNEITENVIRNCFLFSNFTFLNQLLVDQKITLNDILIYSAEFSQQSIFEWISSLPGIDIDHKNSKGQTSLHFGCLNDDFQLVKYILSCNLSSFVDINSKILNEDISPLHIACRNNNTEIAKLLLSHPKIDVNSQTFYTNRMTPLHFACKYGNYEISKLLLQNKSTKINALTYNHQTPFYYACKSGNIEIVKMLINNKADIDTVSKKNEMTPILVACAHEHFDIVKLLVTAKNVNDETTLGETLLLLTSKGGNVDMIKTLISCNANIHSKNKKGLNALHYACKGKDCTEILTFLISNGCDYKEETRNILILFSYCKIPLHYACKHGNCEQVSCLLKYDPTLISKKDGTILFFIL